MLLARPKQGTKPEQYLASHSREAAELASSFANKWGCPSAGFIMGLLHDLGKSQAEWQRIIYDIQSGKKAGEKLPYHSAAGALYAIQKQKDYNKNLLQIMSWAILAHHTGLPADSSDWKRRILKQGKKELDSCDILAFTKEVENEIKRKIPFDQVENLDLNHYSTAMVIRFLLSAIVDADRLNAAGLQPNNSDICNNYRLINLFMDDLEKKTSPSKINEIRSRIRKNVLDNLDKEIPLVAKATIPTGGGKTLSLMQAALKIASDLNKDRIISCVQYCEIITQTAAQYKKVFGKDKVLEHHGLSEAAGLSLENWDHDIIVTSIVQFYESLFTNKAARARKLHNIANSVIIIDEIQTLPSKQLEPLLYVMNELVKNYGCHFILSSATQPDFEYKGFENKLISTEIVDNIDNIEKEMRRVDYYWKKNMTKLEVCSEISKEKQCLIIVNSKKQASRFYSVLSKMVATETEVYHLSTDMTYNDRKRTITKVKQRLNDNLSVILISTSLIEAGVDIDFPCVWRDLAPLDSIIQAAGRCNREGKLKVGKVNVANIEREEGEGIPSEIIPRIKITQRMIDNGQINIDENGKMEIGNKEYKIYFHAISQISNADKNFVVEKEKSLEFKESALGMKIIDEKAEIPIVIACNEDAKDVEKLLKSMMGKAPSKLKSKFRKLQRYEVVLRADEKEKLIIFDMCDRVDVCDSMYLKNDDSEESFLYVLRNSSFYNQNTGLVREPLATIKTP